MRKLSKMGILLNKTRRSSFSCKTQKGQFPFKFIQIRAQRNYSKILYSSSLQRFAPKICFDLFDTLWAHISGEIVALGTPYESPYKVKPAFPHFSISCVHALYSVTTKIMENQALRAFVLRPPTPFHSLGPYL